MKPDIRHRGFAMLAGASLFALVGLAAFAQPTTTQPTATQPAASSAGAADEEAASEEFTLDPAIIVPRRSDRTPPGAAAAKAPSPPDWQAVRAALQDRRDKDAAFERQIRAMELTRIVSEAERERLRPQGLKSVAPEQFQRVLAEEVTQTRVPLLVPVTADTVSNLRVAARENAYTALGDLPDGASFELLGTCMRVIGGAPQIAKARLAKRKEFAKTLASIDASYVISRHEQGVDLSFSKFNCAYMISIYCPDPDGDGRCANDNLVHSLADNLAILNEAEGGTP